MTVTLTSKRAPKTAAQPSPEKVNSHEPIKKALSSLKKTIENLPPGALKDGLLVRHFGLELFLQAGDKVHRS